MDKQETLQHGAALEIARVLTEALPYIQKFHNKTVVIKYGGNAMMDEGLKSSFASDIVLMRLVGLKRSSQNSGTSHQPTSIFSQLP